MGGRNVGRKGEGGREGDRGREEEGDRGREEEGGRKREEGLGTEGGR